MNRTIRAVNFRIDHEQAKRKSELPKEYTHDVLWNIGLERAEKECAANAMKKKKVA